MVLAGESAGSKLEKAKALTSIIDDDKVVETPSPIAEADVEEIKTASTTNVDLANLQNPVYAKFIETTLDENGVLNGITFKNDDKFNFAFDVVDELAKKSPDKTAMLHVENDGTERRFTFADMSRHSNMTANYFKSLGIKKGDKVMLYFSYYDENNEIAYRHSLENLI